MKNRVISFFVLLLFSLSVSAGTWTQSGSIKDIISNNGFIFVYANLDLNLCGNAGAFYWPTSDADSKDMLALVTTAMVTNKNIRFNYDSGNLGCLNSAALVTHAWLSHNQ